MEKIREIKITGNNWDEITNGKYEEKSRRMKPILDACCGARKCWYDKSNPNVVFMDNRKEICTLSDGRTLEVNPDVVADFRHMPFEDNTFSLVLFDPPHYRWCGDNSNLKKIMAVCRKTGEIISGKDSKSA